VSSKDYVVRLYEPGDEEGIIEVLKASYPEWRNAKSPLDHWKWKYLESPLGSVFMVVDWGGKIVAVGGRVLLNIKFDEITPSVYGDDGSVHPDYRRRGIYQDLVRYAWEKGKREETVFKFGIQAHRASVKVQVREGSVDFPFEISHMLQVQNVGMHFRMRPTNNNLAARIGFSALKLLNLIMKNTKRIKILYDFNIEDVVEFDERINFFWQKIVDDYHFIIEKNQRYLNWKYCDPRSSIKGRFMIKKAVANGEILGFIVYKIWEKEDYPEGYIMDLLTLRDRDDVAWKLLEKACKFFRESNINVVHYRVVKDHPYQKLFSEQGFIEVPTELHLGYRIYQDEEKIQIIMDSKPNQIHFNYGDYY
jgi:ribosomal protein S18 acetylase RimI-like enzyme